MKSNSSVRNLLIQVVKLVPFHCQREAIYLLLGSSITESFAAESFPVAVTNVKFMNSSVEI